MNETKWSLVKAGHVVHSVSMSRFDDPEARALGVALAALRRSLGLSQSEAGARMGVTSQAWGLYEAGRRPGMFRPGVQRRLTGALGLTPEDLVLEMTRQGQGVGQAPSERLEDRGRAFSFRGAGEGVDRGYKALQLRDDELAPWADSGVTLIYDPTLWPRRNQGCVAETPGGLVAGLYDRGDTGAIYLKTPSGVERRLERSALGAVAGVVARLEGVSWPS